MSGRRRDKGAPSSFPRGRSEGVVNTRHGEDFVVHGVQV